MRGNLVLTVMVSLMLCSLAMLEVPELLNLTDDTSNDFSLPVIRQSSPSSVINEAPGVGGIASPMLSYGTFDPLPVPPLILHSPNPHDDLLHLLCIQRT